MTAEYRSVQTRMWREDDWFQSLDTDARLLFIYLFTNPSASIAGIYRLPLRTIEFESGIPAERVRELLAEFSAANKVHYDNSVVWVVKMRENQLPAKYSQSKPIETHLAKEIEKIPPGRIKTMYLKHYGYPIDTLSIPYGGTDTETETETETETDTVLPDGKMPAKPPKPPKPPASAQQEMFGAICHTCELNAKVNPGRVAKLAQTLLAAEYTPEQVRGFKDWWQSDPWRMEHTPVPTLAKLAEQLEQFRNSIGRPRASPTASNYTNGNSPPAGTSKVARSLAAVETVRQMLQQQEGGT